MLKTTETLLEGLAANDQSRWARFYRDYAPWIERVLLKRIPALRDTDDVIHETLVELVRIMPTYQYDPTHKGAFHSLIFKIAQNKAIDFLRKRAHEQGQIDRMAVDPTLANGPSSDFNPPFEVSEEEWQRETFDMALRRVFADPAVRETSKIAFRRVVQLGEDAATVARELGLETNTVYQIRNRMKERLRDEVRKIQESSPDGF